MKKISKPMKRPESSQDVEGKESTGKSTAGASKRFRLERKDTKSSDSTKSESESTTAPEMANQGVALPSSPDGSNKMTESASLAVAPEPKKTPALESPKSHDLPFPPVAFESAEPHHDSLLADVEARAPKADIDLPFPPASFETSEIAPPPGYESSKPAIATTAGTSAIKEYQSKSSWQPLFAATEKESPAVQSSMTPASAMPAVKRTSPPALASATGPAGQPRTPALAATAKNQMPGRPPGIVAKSPNQQVASLSQTSRLTLPQKNAISQKDRADNGKQKRKGSSVLTILGLLIVIGAGGGVYIWSNPQLQNSLLQEWQKIAGIPSTQAVKDPHHSANNQQPPKNHTGNPTGQKPPEINPVRLAVNIGWFNEKLVSGILRTQNKGEYLATVDNAIMVYIPEGIFWRGDDTLGNETEKPMKPITLSAYYLDKYEVSNEQYLKFVEIVKFKAPKYLTENNFNELKQPLVGISWSEAQEYAKWAQKRLPTEAEWEKAARGGLEIPDWPNKVIPCVVIPNSLPQRAYPWGNDPITAKRANYKSAADNYPFTAPVNVFKDGVSPYGCYDLAGNVAEWCEDSFDVHYYTSPSGNKDPKASPKKGIKDQKVYRGGSWKSTGEQLMTFRRFSTAPESQHNYVGLRLARDANPMQKK